MNWASANNIVRPVSSGTFALKSNATRAQAADALMNFDRTQQAVPAPGTTSSRATVEMNDPNARPAISGNVSNMEQYDIVFIGYPIWWGQAPRIVSTFFESYDFSGKTIVPFCTSGSSGIGSSATNLHSLTDGATWLSGQRFGGGTSRSTMIQWVNGLGLDITAE